MGLKDCTIINIYYNKYILHFNFLNLHFKFDI